MTILDPVEHALSATRTAGPAAIESPLGADVRLHSMGGIEGLSQLFAYEVDVTSDRSDIAASELLGQSVTISLANGDSTRYWNGRVTALTYLDTDDGGVSRYRLELRPWLWQLSQSADCRTFQNLTIPEIVTQVFQGRGFTDFDSLLWGDYEPKDYVVQYRETDLAFVTRLLEREGIYYFFRHEERKHTLVLADSPQAHEAAPGCDTLPFAGGDEHRDATMQYVRSWRAEAALKTGVYTQTDYDFTKPRVDLSARASSANDDAAAGLERYDFPGGFDSFAAADAITRVRLDQARRDAERRFGRTNAPGLTAGATFTLSDHPRESENAKYLVIWARVRIKAQDADTSSDDEDIVTTSFVCVDASLTFRPPLTVPKPIMRGLQTAVVVGPRGQEIWTDRYGRIKVQFFWDRVGGRDENSSCWIRVGQQWAGTGFGAQFIPRVGQEVIVDFLEGDPDRPIVTGCVYNGSNDTPFELPGSQTQSGWRSRSTPDGTLATGNEIRFEDAAGAEDLYIHAQGTQTTTVNARQSITVGTDRSVSVTGAETVMVGQTRSLSVGTVSTTKVGLDSTETVGGLRSILSGSNMETFGGGSAVTVGGDLVTKVGGVTRFDLGASLTVGVSGDETRTAGGKLQVRAGDDASYVYATATKTVVGHPDRLAGVTTFVYGTSSESVSKELTLESDTSVTLKSGDTTIVITPDGVTITGKTLTWAAGSKLAASSPNATLTLDDNVAAVGKKATISSSGAQLALDSNAALTGSKVQLGSGSGGSASASPVSSNAPESDKPVYIRTKILRHGKPAAGVSYKLVLDGTTTLSGSTTGDGLVEQKVPATVATAVLTLLDTGDTRTLVISALEPVTTTVGAQSRLKRLGFYHGPLNGEMSPLTVHAIETFQQSKSLTVNGTLDSATQDALKAAYGS